MIERRTLEEACANGDGTYDGIGLMQWLFQATTGRPISREEVEADWRAAQARREAKS